MKVTILTTLSFVKEISEFHAVTPVIDLLVLTENNSALDAEIKQDRIDQICCYQLEVYDSPLRQLSKLVTLTTVYSNPVDEAPGETENFISTESSLQVTQEPSLIQKKESDLESSEFHYPLFVIKYPVYGGYYGHHHHHGYGIPHWHHWHGHGWGPHYGGHWGGGNVWPWIY